MDGEEMKQTGEVSRTLVTYRLRPECVEENEAMVREVSGELRSRAPDEIRYLTLRLDDGVTFVHLHEAPAGDRTLPGLGAFARFQERIGDRCVEPPTVSRATEIGSFGFSTGRG